MSKASGDSAVEFWERRSKRQWGNEIFSSILMMIQDQKEEWKLDHQHYEDNKRWEHQCYEEDKKLEREWLELQCQEMINQQQWWEMILMKMMEKE